MKPSRHRKSSEIYSRPKKDTKMSRHKISPNEGSQAVALREAMIKLQELELQSTENRVKVGHEHVLLNFYINLKVPLLEKMP